MYIYYLLLLVHIMYVCIFWYHGYCPHSPLLSSSSSQEHWLPLVAEHEKDVLEWTACVNGDRLILCYLQDVKVRRCECRRACACMRACMCACVRNVCTCIHAYYKASDRLGGNQVPTNIATSFAVFCIRTVQYLCVHMEMCMHM